MQLVDLEGKTFGSLTVLSMGETDSNVKRLWLCKCECGNRVNIPSGDLTRGRKKSCGCHKLKVEM